MPFRATWEKKSGSERIGFSVSGFVRIKNDDWPDGCDCDEGFDDDPVDGGDCDGGFDVVCGCDEEEAAQRMVAAIAHPTGRLKQKRDNRVRSVTPTLPSPS